MFEALRERGYDVRTLHHSRSIIDSEFADAVLELERIIIPTQIPIEELIKGGGGKTKVVQRLEKRFKDHDWLKHNFHVKKLVDEIPTQSISHEIDHIKRFEEGVLALEIEWNNKDPFFDRDLQNFRQLHSDGAISIGIVITRGQSLQYGLQDMIVDFARAKNINSLEKLEDYYTPTKPQKRSILNSVENGIPFEQAWASNFMSSKFGKSTTHWDKLMDRINRGVGNPCPLILIGIPINVVQPYIEEE